MNDSNHTGAVVVALFDLGASTGGPRRARQLARLLAAAGARPHLVGFKAPGAEARAIAAPLAADGVAVTLLEQDAAAPAHRVRNLLGLPWTASERGAVLAAIRTAVAAHRAKVLVLYNQDLIAARVIARLCRELGVAFVQQYAEAHVAADFRLGVLSGRWWSERRHLRSAPRFSGGSIVISRFLRDAVGAAGGGEMLLLPSFVDVAEWDARLAAVPAGGRGGDPHLVYAGEGARRDCVPEIVAAVGRLRRTGFACRASFVGVARGGNPDFLPRATPDQLAIHYRSAGAFVLLRTDDRSSRACLPTRLGEMLLAARPVVASDLPDYNVHLRHGENAYLLRGTDPGRIAETLRAALADNEANAAIGRRGRETALATFDWRAHRATVAAWLTRVANPPTRMRSCAA